MVWFREANSDFAPWLLYMNMYFYVFPYLIIDASSIDVPILLRIKLPAGQAEYIEHLMIPMRKSNINIICIDPFLLFIYII